MTGPRFSDRDHALYRVLFEAADAGMPTPRHAELIEAMAASGHKVTKDMVANCVLKLKQANMIDVRGAGDASGSHRYYVIIGPDLQTIPRSKAPALAEDSWASFGRYDCAAYDAAVASKMFGMHEVRPRSRQTFVHRRVAGVAARSYVGCSAAMVA